MPKGTDEILESPDISREPYSEIKYIMLSRLVICWRLIGYADLVTPKNSIRHSKQIKLGYPTLLGNQWLIKIGFFWLWLVFWLFSWFPGLSGSVRFGFAFGLALVRSDRIGLVSWLPWLPGLAWLVWLGCIADPICDLVLVVVLFGLAIPVETHPVAMDPFSGGWSGGACRVGNPHNNHTPSQ